MSTRELNVGATVHFTRTAHTDLSRTNRTIEAPEYRVEHLMKVPDGATLYTIKNEAEPFERLVAASDLDRRG